MQLTTALLLFTLPFFSILVPLIQGLSNKIHVRSLVPYWSIAGLLLTLGAIAVMLSQGFPQAQLILNVLSIDGFSVYFSAIFVGITLLIGVASISYMRGNKNLDTYFALLLLATLA